MSSIYCQYFAKVCNFNGGIPILQYFISAWSRSRYLPLRSSTTLETILATVTMPSHDTSSSLSDTETTLLNSLASRFSINTDEQARLEEACRLLEPNTSANTASVQVGIAQVSTLVCTGKGSLPGTTYVVPPFAVHWGVIVRRTLFHLRYNSKQKSIKFCWQPWDQTQNGSRHKVDLVGTTKYNTDDIITIGIHGMKRLMIGEKLISAFGDYQRLFWNCQIFAKVFLRAICEESEVEFGHWTSADTTKLIHLHSLSLIISSSAHLLLPVHLRVVLKKRRNGGFVNLSKP
jgi:hypothetical protein